MAWQQWFREFKVPREVQRLVDAGLMRDTTKWFSLAPNFEATMSDARILTLHVGHPSREARIGFGRYEIAIRQPNGFSETLLETDKLSVAMEALRALLSAGGGPPTSGPMLGCPEGSWWIPDWHMVEY